MRRLIVTLFVFCPGLAVAAELDSLEGRYGFDWHSDPEKTRCVRVDSKLIVRFGSPSYRCDLTPFSNTASGASAVKCSKKDGNVEYLIFTTKAACETERQTQAANGE